MASCAAVTSTTGEPDASEAREDESEATLAGVSVDLVLEATDELREGALELRAALELLTVVNGENEGAKGEEAVRGESSAKGEEAGDHGLSVVPLLVLLGMGIRACRVSGKYNPVKSHKQVTMITNEQTTTPHAHATCSRVRPLTR